MIQIRLLLIPLLTISLSAFSQPRYLPDSFWGLSLHDVEVKEGELPDYTTIQKSKSKSIDQIEISFFNRSFAGYSAETRYHFSFNAPKVNKYILRWITYRIFIKGNGLSPMQIMDEIRDGINRNRPDKIHDEESCMEKWYLNVAGLSKDEGLQKGVYYRNCSWGGLETQLSYNHLGYVEVTYAWPIKYNMNH